jgi:hypothetical protein
MDAAQPLPATFGIAARICEHFDTHLVTPTQ